MEYNMGNCVNTKERILQATLDIIGNEGFQSVTSRKIAHAAGVNVAAVNYYFGSKDNVVNEAVKCLAIKLMECFNVLDNKEKTVEDRLREFLRNYADVTLKYPDIFRNLVNQTINNYNLPSEYKEFIQQSGCRKLKGVLQELDGMDCGIHNDLIVFQLISSLVFPVLVGKQMKNFSGIEYEDRDVRYEYVEILLKSIIG